VSLLIDADYIVYKSCAANETEIDWGEDLITVTSNFSEAYGMVERELASIADCLGCFDNSILFFSDSVNFRKKIDPEYKGHRNRKKPCGYKRVINKLAEDYHVVILPELEADDAIGIYATKESGHIVCSPDKDMRQIPGDLFDLTQGVVTITPEMAHKWHFVQTLAGDQTDGYAGVPGIGIKRAEALFEKNGYVWKTIVDAFAEKDLSEEIALKNARLAKILQVEDYDFTTEKPILWTPSTSNGVNNGAELQVEASAGPTA
jgi:DNA polymerase-1